MSTGFLNPISPIVASLTQVLVDIYAIADGFSAA
jgi:hypothetical protein